MSHLDGTELDALWDFSDPAGSESRLRTAADSADGVAAAELRTQVARALGLQEQYTEAFTLLDGISTNDAVVQQRIALERGRVFNSSGDINSAIPQFQEAYRIDADTYLTVDAIHMLGIADEANEETWFQRGIELAQRSQDPRVRRWEGSLRNNHAWNLADAGNMEAALAEFQHAEEWYRQHGTPRQQELATQFVAEIQSRILGSKL